MTGAVFPVDAVDKWREFWEKEKGSIKLAQKNTEPKKTGDTVGGLFGIPVQGSRVLFIVDLSRSMTFEMDPEFKLPSGKRPTRMEFAQEALRKVIQEMPEATKFNFITYNGNPKAEVWNKDMIAATAKNKEKALKFVEAFRPDGGTNMWAGLEEGLKMKSLVYGDRYETTVDEMFVVSDGAPSVGDIVDAQEILNLVTETNRFSKVRINTIFMTSDNEEERNINRMGGRKQSLLPDELMEKMAKQNGGTFKNIGKKR
jgi:hypothetical protein